MGTHIEHTRNLCGLVNCLPRMEREREREREIKSSMLNNNFNAQTQKNYQITLPLRIFSSNRRTFSKNLLIS